jgi:hypothetical protein
MKRHTRAFFLAAAVGLISVSHIGPAHDRDLIIRVETSGRGLSIYAVSGARTKRIRLSRKSQERMASIRCRKNAR